MVSVYPPPENSTKCRKPKKGEADITHKGNEASGTNLWTCSGVFGQEVFGGVRVGVGSTYHIQEGNSGLNQGFRFGILATEHVCQGLNSLYFHIIGDKLINPSP